MENSKYDIKTENQIWFADDMATFNAIEENDRFLRIEGLGCHFGKPNLNGEIVDSSSFNDFFTMYNNGQLNPLLNYQHDQNQVIGTIDEITTTNEGLFFRASINKDVEICRTNLVPNIKNGVIRSFSTEGIIKNGYDGIEQRENNTYFVRSFLLTGLAVVNLPADPKATFTVSNMLKEREALKQRQLDWRLFM